MSETLKLTAEELKQAKDFQRAIGNLTYQIGEIAINQQAAIRQLNQIKEAQFNFNNEIGTKYGDVAFDINTGEAIQEQIVQQDAPVAEEQAQ